MIVTTPVHADSGHSLIGQSCSARPTWVATTLADVSPVPLVTVPRGSWGTAADVHVAHEAILPEECTVLLPRRRQAHDLPDIRAGQDLGRR
jgi:hypothetical protein